MSSLPIELVYAVARNGVIGRDNVMPWRLPSDLAHFKRVTLGNPVIMGRKTFESIGKPLPERTNIVMTRDGAFAPIGVTVAHSADDALTAARSSANARTISVIGGAEIYRQFMPHARRLIVTHVKAEPDGDTTMPPVDPDVWIELSREAGQPHPNDTARVEFAVYERRDRD